VIIVVMHHELVMHDKHEFVRHGTRHMSSCATEQDT